MAGSVPCCRCGEPVAVKKDPRQKRTCLSCIRAQGRAKMKRWIARNLEEHRRRSSASASWKIRDKSKTNAKMAVHRALKAGKLTRKPCEVCGKVKVDAHHTDYSKPLDVQWLCRAHHLELHRKEAA